MPKATVPTETKRVDLKTLEGAYVVIKRIGYLDTLKRQDQALDVVGTDDGSGRSVRMGARSERVQLFDFANCIVEHNLEEETSDGSMRLLDLSSEQDLGKLDPTIAAEIEKAIDDLNSGGSIEGNSLTPSSNGNSATPSATTSPLADAT